MIRLDQLCKELQDKLPALFLEWAKRAAPGDRYIPLSGYRSNAEQAAAYAVGRSGIRKNERIITNRRPGTSAHNALDKAGNPASKALDFGVLRYGKYITNGDDLAYKIGGAVAEEMGLEWSGRWTGKLKEAAHIQVIGA